MDEENEVYKIKCYTSENKQTKRFIEVILWSEKDESGFHIVTITTNKGDIPISIKDVPDLISLLQLSKNSDT